MTDLIILDSSNTHPETLIRDHCNELKTSVEQQRYLLIHYEFTQYWLDEQPQCRLSAWVQLTQQAQDICIQFTVTDQSCDLAAYLAAIDDIDFSAVCDRFLLPYFFIDQPIPLASVSIPKPWGQEIWFTGIEERGVSAACCGQRQLPLPWVLSVFPGALCAGRQQSLILLKILDPLPQPVLGDLYFELHQQKREVYVVTAVDQTAWPDQQGEIRFGIDQNKRQHYASDADFRQAFIDAVKAYEVIRRQIDELLDQKRALLPDSSAVDADSVHQWLQELPESLCIQEQQLRLQMESFTDRRTLAVGDVVKVPCLTPHSLQHGVRTVEFQTPVYERLIVSFAQKVLTQNHWNTEQAVALMNLEYSAHTDIERLYDAEGVVIDRIVDFEDFDVRRIVLQRGACWFMDSPALYGLCMGVEGNLEINTATVQPEQAVLLTHSCKGQWICNKNDAIMSFLLANPK